MKEHFFRCVIGILLLVLYNNVARSQAVQFGGDKLQWEVGLNIGPNFFFGDMGGNRGLGQRFIKDINLSMTTLNKGVYVTAYPVDWLGIRAVAQFGSITAADNVIKNHSGEELFRKQRNLDFKSKLTEAYIGAEIYPLQLLFNSYGDYNPRLMPYGLIGIGVFHFNPQGSLTDANGNKTWYYLRPLHTEGEGFSEFPNRKEYSLTQMNIPIGIGLKYWINDRINISTEITFRKTFTDYIDDISTTYIDPSLFDKYLSPQNAAIAKQIFDKSGNIVADPRLASGYSTGDKRGDPTHNDSWVTTFLKFGWRFTSNPDRNLLKRMSCPTRF